MIWGYPYFRKHPCETSELWTFLGTHILVIYTELMIHQAGSNSKDAFSLWVRGGDTPKPAKRCAFTHIQKILRVEHRKKTCAIFHLSLWTENSMLGMIGYESRFRYDRNSSGEKKYLLVLFHVILVCTKRKKTIVRRKRPWRFDYIN